MLVYSLLNFIYAHTHAHIGMYINSINISLRSVAKVGELLFYDKHGLVIDIGSRQLDKFAF